MDLLSGIKYNLKGLMMGIKTKNLLFWGLVRFALVIVITILGASLILSYNQEIISLLWDRPQSRWVLWLWYLMLWLLTLLLVAIAALISYLLSQIFFGVIIMDHMSQITEKIVSGKVDETVKMPIFSQFLYLIKQEIPRAIIPVLLALLIMILGWLTPLGPVFALISSGIAVIFLAWDNSDLTPARRMISFSNRFQFLKKRLMFHLGFGLLFLIPGLNILSLSFAPVGATLYYLDQEGVDLPESKDS
jgi:CysZ protein